MKVEFLADLEKIFEFLLRETVPEKMFDIVYDEIKELTESYVLQRDIENFIAYFKVIISAPKIPRKMTFDSGLVRAFINRTYTGLADSTLRYRADQLHEYLQSKISAGGEITNECLDNLSLELEVMKTPTLAKIMERARVATILKWLQGPLREKLSLELQDNAVFLATIYGQYRKNLAINIDWEPCEVAPEDIEILVSEYRVLEIAIIEALEMIRNARRANPDLNRYEEQFQIVLTSLDNLGKMEEAGNLDSFDSLKDRLIISTSLIYIQDDFVQKDAELKQLIQLFVSLYFKFRDRHYDDPEKTDLNSRDH
ncbi:MAG: hypothetical protein JSU64_05380 [candidate division WOR-3 bacterium]|nr:MAG: hypothetical protein JSU64_05380 [candidate division WOR-3 bacterium]